MPWQHSQEAVKLKWQLCIWLQAGMLFGHSVKHLQALYTQVDAAEDEEGLMESLRYGRPAC